MSIAFKIIIIKNMYEQNKFLYINQNVSLFFVKTRIISMKTGYMSNFKLNGAYWCMCVNFVLMDSVLAIALKFMR